jgi:hypothetical protein
LCHQKKNNLQGNLEGFSSKFKNTYFIRVWEEVATGIMKNDEEHALTAKRHLEEVQRREDEERNQKKVQWTPKLFVKNSEGIYYYHKFE